MSIFTNVGGFRPQRSVFNISHTVKTTADMGLLYPILAEDVLPGDKFTLANRVVCRMKPMVAPVMHDIFINVDYFFVPYRLIWDDFELFITKGTDGDTTVSPPLWIPKIFGTGDITPISPGSLWDSFGFPTRSVSAGPNEVVQWDGFPDSPEHQVGAPVDFIRRGYYFIWNEYYRDQNLQEEIDYTSYQPNGVPEHQSLMRRAWRKDYFTSALPWQQRGTAPSVPLSGVASVSWNDSLSGRAFSDIWSRSENMPYEYAQPSLLETNDSIPTQRKWFLYHPTDPTAEVYQRGRLRGRINSDGIALLNNNTLSLDNVGTFTPDDLRLCFAIQRWQEVNARTGVRYTEFLQGHYNVSPKDARLQRPEFIGSTRQPLIISEVLQTSETTSNSPQGSLAGHGISVDNGFAGKYFSEEFGMIYGILSIMPRADYQQGIRRQYTRKTPFEYPFPEFSRLSEQAVHAFELYLQGHESDGDIFGYQGRWNELRVGVNSIRGDFRTTLDYWHLGRQFTNAPRLNEDFITCNPDKRIFAEQTENEFLLEVHNKIRAVRPIPVSSEPGLLA